MRTSKGGTRAWVVRWEWSSDNAAVEPPVAAVLRPRLWVAQVKRIMEALYASRETAPSDMLAAIRGAGHNAYKRKLGTVNVGPDRDGRRQDIPWQGEISCGHNPWLVARQARVWPSEDESEIRWEDDPRPDR